jgi:hypothetical protein
MAVGGGGARRGVAVSSYLPLDRRKKRARVRVEKIQYRDNATRDDKRAAKDKAVIVAAAAAADRWCDLWCAE